MRLTVESTWALLLRDRSVDARPDGPGDSWSHYSLGCGRYTLASGVVNRKAGPGTLAFEARRLDQRKLGRSGAARDWTSERRRVAAASAMSGASSRSVCAKGTLSRSALWACCRRGEVLSGARKSTPWHAARNSSATMLSAFAAMAGSRRAPWVAMLTWSSWFAEVGMLSTLAGWHSMRFSATSAAAVTCATMKPE